MAYLLQLLGFFLIDNKGDPPGVLYSKVSCHFSSLSFQLSGMPLANKRSLKILKLLYLHCDLEYPKVDIR